MFASLEMIGKHLAFFILIMPALWRSGENAEEIKFDTEALS